jgi:hypothetical protein
MTASIRIPTPNGTIVLDRPAPRKGNQIYTFISLEIGGTCQVIADLSLTREGLTIDSPATAVSPDGLYIICYRSEALGDAADGGPGRQSQAIFGIREGGWVSFVDRYGLSVSGDVPFNGWNATAAHELVVLRNFRHTPALPMSEANTTPLTLR